jgi:glycosyltransferase involved in cell wall biosynthesis
MMQQQIPFFSVIIPTYNRPEQLATCLESLTRLDYRHQDFEVIVVDDGSKKPLEPVVARFHDQLNLTLIKQDNAGPASARNTGVTRARGRYLAFTDDDCMPAPDWLTTLGARFAIAPSCMIGGRILNALNNNLYSTASQLLIDYFYDYFYTYFNTGSDQASYFTSNNMALASKLFRALGGFDTTFTLAAEDRELCDRWLHHRHEMIYAPEVRVYHAHKLTLPTFWRQHFNYGRGAFNFERSRAARTDGRIKIAPINFFNFLTYPLLQKSNQPKILLTALFMLSQVAGVAGFFLEGLNQYKLRKDYKNHQLLMSIKTKGPD